MLFSFSKSFSKAFGGKTSLRAAGDSFRRGESARPNQARPQGQPSGSGLDFSKSLTKIVDAKEKAEQHRVDDILHPDTSGRLRFASFGDPPRQKPQRAQFESDSKFQAAVAHWSAEQVADKVVYEKALR